MHQFDTKNALPKYASNLPLTGFIFVVFSSFIL